MEDRLLEMIPGKYYRSQVSGGGMNAQVETWIRAERDGTEVTGRWSATGEKLLVRLMLPFMKNSVMRQMNSDQETFKELVEEHGARFPVN